MMLYIIFLPQPPFSFRKIEAQGLDFLKISYVVGRRFGGGAEVPYGKDPWPPFLKTIRSNLKMAIRV
jgi:hypothetical protein